jgi:hypothetical protein
MSDNEDAITQRFERDYVHFDEREDVLASLELLELISPLLGGTPSYWKWMIVGAESALQGAMVCALQDSTGTSVLSKKSRIEMLNWLQAGGEDRGDPPQEWLAKFEELLEKCISELGLNLRNGQRRDIDRLHEYFRNNFIHFTPKGWAIQKAGLPRMIGAALDAVSDLMGMHRASAFLDEKQSLRFTRALKATRANLKSIGGVR